MDEKEKQRADSERALTGRTTDVNKELVNLVNIRLAELEANSKLITSLSGVATNVKELSKVYDSSMRMIGLLSQSQLEKAQRDLAYQQRLIEIGAEGYENLTKEQKEKELVLLKAAYDKEQKNLIANDLKKERIYQAHQKNVGGVLNSLLISGKLHLMKADTVTEKLTGLGFEGAASLTLVAGGIAILLEFLRDLFSGFLKTEAVISRFSGTLGGNLAEAIRTSGTVSLTAAQTFLSESEILKDVEQAHKANLLTNFDVLNVTERMGGAQTYSVAATRALSDQMIRTTADTKLLGRAMGLSDQEIKDTQSIIRAYAGTVWSETTNVFGGLMLQSKLLRVDAGQLISIYSNLIKTYGWTGSTIESLSDDVGGFVKIMENLGGSVGEFYRTHGALAIKTIEDLSTGLAKLPYSEILAFTGGLAGGTPIWEGIKGALEMEPLERMMALSNFYLRSGTEAQPALFSKISQIVGDQREAARATDMMTRLYEKTGGNLESLLSETGGVNLSALEAQGENINQIINLQKTIEFTEKPLEVIKNTLQNVLKAILAISTSVIFAGKAGSDLADIRDFMAGQTPAASMRGMGLQRKFFPFGARR